MNGPAATLLLTGRYLITLDPARPALPYLVLNLKRWLAELRALRPALSAAAPARRPIPRPAPGRCRQSCPACGCG